MKTDKSKMHVEPKALTWGVVTRDKPDADWTLIAMFLKRSDAMGMVNSVSASWDDEVEAKCIEICYARPSGAV